MILYIDLQIIFLYIVISLQISLGQISKKIKEIHRLKKGDYSAFICKRDCKKTAEKIYIDSTSGFRAGALHRKN